MGGLFSKKEEVSKIDLSNATLSVGDAQKQLSEGIAAAKASAMASDWKWFATVFYWFAGLLILGAIGVGIYYAFFANKGPTNPRSSKLWYCRCRYYECSQISCTWSIN